MLDFHFPPSSLVLSDGPCSFEYPGTPRDLVPLIYRLDNRIYAHLRNIPDLIESARSSLLKARLTSNRKSRALGHVLNAAWIADAVSDWISSSRNGRTLLGGWPDAQMSLVGIYGTGEKITYGLAGSLPSFMGN